MAKKGHPVRPDGPAVETLHEIVTQAFRARGHSLDEAEWDAWRDDEASGSHSCDGTPVAPRTAPTGATSPMLTAARSPRSTTSPPISSIPTAVVPCAT